MLRAARGLFLQVMIIGTDELSILVLRVVSGLCVWVQSRSEFSHDRVIYGCEALCGRSTGRIAFVLNNLRAVLCFFRVLA